LLTCRRSQHARHHRPWQGRLRKRAERARTPRKPAADDRVPRQPDPL